MIFRKLRFCQAETEFFDIFLVTTKPAANLTAGFYYIL